VVDTSTPLCYRWFIVARLSQKLRSFAAALYWTKRAACNRDHHSHFFVNQGIFGEDMRQKRFSHFGPFDLDL